MAGQAERRRPGRKQQLGKLVVDERQGKLGINMGYCDNCGEKHLLQRDEVDQLMRWVRKDEKSRAGRIFRWIIQSRLL